MQPRLRMSGRAAVLRSLLSSSRSLAPASASRRRPGARLRASCGQQAETDGTWRAASEGFMRMEKISYRSRAGDLDIPAFVFRPLDTRARAAVPRSSGCTKTSAAISTNTTFRTSAKPPRAASSSSRRSIAAASGTARRSTTRSTTAAREVDDVVTAVEVLRTRYPRGRSDAIGIIGWSHGGMIALLSIFRNPTMFNAAAAIVPVTNLFHRLARKGVEKQRALIDPQNRFGGSPSESPQVYGTARRSSRSTSCGSRCSSTSQERRGRRFRGGHAARGRAAGAQAAAAVTKVYDHPLGGHTFDRRVNLRTWQPENTPEQRDSWTRVWRFLERTLGTSGCEPSVALGGPRRSLPGCWNLGFPPETWASSAVGSAHEWHS